LAAAAAAAAFIRSRKLCMATLKNPSPDDDDELSGSDLRSLWIGAAAIGIGAATVVGFAAIVVTGIDKFGLEPE